MNEKTLLLDLKEVIGNPEQPRKTFSSSYIDELANSIKANGQELPGVVIPVSNIVDRQFALPNSIKYVIISGESRFRACQKLGIPYKASVVSEQLTCKEILIKALVENEQRKNPSPIENAKAYQTLVDSGMTITKVAKKVGKQIRYIETRLALLKLKPIYQLAIEQKGISLSQGVEISRLDFSEQDAVMRMIDSGKIRGYPETITAVEELLNKRQQSGFGFSNPVPPTAKEKRKQLKLKKTINAASSVIKECYRNGEVILPTMTLNDAEKLKQEIKLIQNHLNHIEKKLADETVRATVHNQKYVEFGIDNPADSIDNTQVDDNTQVVDDSQNADKLQPVKTEARSVTIPLNAARFQAVKAAETGTEFVKIKEFWTKILFDKGVPVEFKTVTFRLRTEQVIVKTFSHIEKNGNVYNIHYTTSTGE